MTAHVSPPASALPAPPAKPTKHRLTLAEVRQLWDSGAVAGYPSIELIDGDIYEMPADGDRMIDWNAALLDWLFDAVDRKVFRIVADKTLDVAPHYAPKPDIWIHDRALKTADLTGATAALVIEVSDTTLAWDRDVKAPAYEAGGVREHWRIECAGKRIMVYRLGADGRYGAPREAAFTDEVEALLTPGLKLRLADLPGLDDQGTD